MPARNGIVLGVDSGSTKTHLALADGSGRVIAFVEDEGTGHEGKGFPSCARILKRMIGEACRQSGASRRAIRASCFGVCGADLPEDIGQIKRNMVGPMGISGRVDVYNDAYLPIHNDGYRERGVGVTCGGWHKWVGSHGDRVFMHEGSAFVGVRQLVEEELTWVCEGFKKPSPFTDGLLRFLGFKGYSDYFKRRRYGDTRSYLKPIPREQYRRFVHVPKYLGRQAARGSRVAFGVINRYAMQVARGVDVVARKVGINRGGYDVILSGSVLVGIPELHRAVGRFLRRISPRARTRAARFRPVRGALVFAAHRAWGSLPAGALQDRNLLYP